MSRSVLPKIHPMNLCWTIIFNYVQLSFGPKITFNMYLWKEGGEEDDLTGGLLLTRNWVFSIHIMKADDQLDNKLCNEL